MSKTSFKAMFLFFVLGYFAGRAGPTASGAVLALLSLIIYQQTSKRNALFHGMKTHSALDTQPE
jgi:hypothetical protein